MVAGCTRKSSSVHDKNSNYQASWGNHIIIYIFFFCGEYEGTYIASEKLSLAYYIILYYIKLEVAAWSSKPVRELKPEV